MTTEFVFGLSNPLIAALVIMLIILSFVYIFYRYVMIPLQKQHVEEKQNLRLQQAELMAMFAQSDPDPVFRFEIDGNIQLANSPGMELLKGSTLTDMKIWNIIPETKSINLAECIRNGNRQELFSKIAGKHYKFIICGIPRFEIGQIYGSEITDLKKTEEQLTVALAKAEESEKLKSHFLSQMSHEIRTPLNAILGLSSIIHDEVKDKLPNDLQDMFRSIDNSGKRLYRTIDLNLNMALVLTGGFKYSLQRIDVMPILNQLIIEYRHYAKEKNLTFTFEAKIQNPSVLADAFSFSTIVHNLLDNAIKYTKAGSVTVSVFSTQSGEIAINIKDTGIGMSAQYLEQLFQPFTQEEMGYSRPFEGNGLGLALTKRLIDLNNGEIRISSNKHDGTSVTVFFRPAN